MKQGWENIGLGEICEVLDAQRKPITKRNRIEGDIPYYGATGIVDWVKDYLFDEPLILLGEDGAKWDSGDNSAFKIEGKTWVNNHAHVLRPFRDKVVDNWLIYYLNFQNLQSFITGFTVPKLNQGNMRKIPIPIPPFDEQKHIVAKLDECFEAIDKARANVEKNLSNARELFKSQVNQIFTQKGDGWVEKKLVEVCEEFGRGKSKHRPRNDRKLFGGDYPFIQTGDVRNAQKIIAKYSQTYNEIGLSQSKQWRKGTVCITIAANIAETAILGFSGCFPDSIIGFNADLSKTTNQYVYYLLQFYKEQLQKLGKGSGQDNINLGTFNKQSFPFPNLEIQNKIVKKLDRLKSQTQSLEPKYQQELDALDELKKSILQKAFNGEL